MVFQRYFTITLLAALSAGMAYSQEQSQEQNESGVKAAGSALVYQSAFSDYKSFREPEVMSWRTSNDLVRGAGEMDGMAGHDMSKINSSGEMSGSEKKSKKPGSADKSASPAHVMGSMKNSDSVSEHAMSEMKMVPAPAIDSARARGRTAGQKKGLSAHDKGTMTVGSGAATKDMPEQDMEKVRAPASDEKPARTRTRPIETQGTKNSMPGHDMSNMEKNMPPKSVPGTPEPAAKSNVSEQPMDHSKMKNKE